MTRFFPALALPLLMTPLALGQEQHPIAARVKSELKDPSKPFAMVITLKVKDGAGDRFEAAFAKALKETRKEKGYLAYDLNRDAKEAGRYMVYERWKSLADLEAHLASDHFKALLSAVGELFDGEPEVKVMLPVAE